MKTGVHIERRQLVLERAIKLLGLHEVQVALHPEVEASITVNVARSAEEAELQAQGKTIGSFDDEFERDVDSELAVEAAAEDADDSETEETGEQRAVPAEG